MKRVYFMRRSDCTGPIKIGCSSCPADRRRQICSIFGDEFALLATAPGDFLTERNLHLKFADLRAPVPDRRPGRATALDGSTEWFHPTAELLAYIETVRATDEIQLTPEGQRERVFAERYLAGETLQQIADDFDITRERVRQILRAIGVESLGHRPEHVRRHEETPADRAAIQAYIAGEQPQKICSRLGIKYHQLRLALIRAGVQLGKPGRWRDPETDKKSEQVAFLYRRGLRPSDIAEKVGLSHATEVYRHLKRIGVKPRTRKGRRPKAEAA